MVSSVNWGNLAVMMSRAGMSSSLVNTALDKAREASRYEEEQRRAARPGTCPYNACGGACGGKGYYDYHGHTIFCSGR